MIENYEDELPRIFNYINMRTPINAYEIIKRPTSTSSSKENKNKRAAKQVEKRFESQKG
ncbi:MAG: hypothetical protein F7B11_04985 [Caldisphaeraceae archaeon]|nr:hypothetical protein [Caldisphaeraceae archaeon]